MRRLLYILLTGPLSAAVWHVQTAACPGGSGTGNCFNPVSMANVQAAVNAAACADSILIEHAGLSGALASFTGANSLTWNKSCAAGSEITLDSDQDPTWLPQASLLERPLPAYRSHLWKIQLDAPVTSTAAIIIGSQKSPTVSGLILRHLWGQVGAGYSGVSPNQYSHWFFVGPVTSGAIAAADTLSVIPDNITVNDSLFYGDYVANHSAFAELALVDVKKFSFQNNVVQGVNGMTSTNNGGSFDSQLLMSVDYSGPATIRNNISCCGWTEHIFTMGLGHGLGANAGAPQGCAPGAGCLIEHNVFLNAIRFMTGSSTFVGASDRPFIKNCVEFKEGADSIIRWNTCVNSWNNDFGQYFGYFLRHIMSSNVRADFGTGLTATLGTGVNGANSRVTINGTLAAGVNVQFDHLGSAIGICKVASCTENDAGFVAGQWEYHKIINSLTPGCTLNCQYDVDAGYTGAFTATNAVFMVVVNAWTKQDHDLVESNVCIDVADCLNYEGGDLSDYCLAVPNCGSNIIYRNNLSLIKGPQANFAGSGASLQSGLWRATTGANNLRIEHNQQVVLPSAHTNAQTVNDTMQFDGLSARAWTGLRVLSNAAQHPSSFGYTTAEMPTPGFFTGWVSLLGAGSAFLNNSFVGTLYNNLYAGATPSNLQTICGGIPCRNIYQVSNVATTDFHYTNPAANDFSARADRVAVCGATNATPIVIQTCAPHNFLVGQPVRTRDVGGNAAANGLSYVNAVVDSTHFSLQDQTAAAVAGTGAYTGGGTVVYGTFQGGHDGQDVGADMRLLPLIQALTVSPSRNYVTFTYRVPLFLANYSCQWEVAPGTSGLVDDAADYTPVSAVNPAFFKRADSDHVTSRAGQSPATVSADGVQRKFQIGDAGAPVTGDDGLSHSLQLTPGSNYQYRVFCGGAMERGTFATLP